MGIDTASTQTVRRSRRERDRWPLRRFAVVVAFLLAGVGSFVAIAVPGGPATAPGTVTVRAGDTLGAIAARIGVDGGWQALYQANRTTIGADPAQLKPGMVLTVPRTTAGAAVASANYVVQPGDTLTSISAHFHLSGGVDSLYAANRTSVGQNADRLVVGEILTLPAPPAAARPADPTGTTSAGSAHVVTPAQVRTAPALAAPSTGTSRAPWRWALVGLCAAGAALAFALLRRSRRGNADAAELTPTGVLTFVQGGTAEVPAIMAATYGATQSLPGPRTPADGRAPQRAAANSATAAASNE